MAESLSSAKIMAIENMMNQTLAPSEMPTIATTIATSIERRSPSVLHPNFLLVQWEIHSRNGQWQAALNIAEALVAALPGEPIGWIYRSFALHKLGRVEEARQQLLTGARRFPADWRIAYNLACYVCQLGDFAGALNWLDRAMELGDADVLKSLALDEPAFQPLWQRASQPVCPSTESHEQIVCA
jgi:Flp pilus assembly protein TadD